MDDKFSVLLNYSPAENGLGAANSVRLFFTCEDAPKGILADAERLESSSFLIRVPAKKNRSARRMLGNLTHELVHVVQTTHHNIRKFFAGSVSAAGSVFLLGWKCYCDRRGVACTHHGEYDTADDAVSEELLGDDCLHHGPYFQAWVRLIHDRFDSAIPGGYPDMMLVGDEDLGCAAPPPPRRLVPMPLFYRGCISLAIFSRSSNAVTMQMLDPRLRVARCSVALRISIIYNIVSCHRALMIFQEDSRNGLVEDWSVLSMYSDRCKLVPIMFIARSAASSTCIRCMHLCNDIPLSWQHANSLTPFRAYCLASALVQ